MRLATKSVGRGGTGAATALRICCALIVAVGLWACSKQEANSAPSGDKAAAKAPKLGKASSLGGISVQTPEGWREEKPSSSMRRGQWKIGSGDSELELVVFFFGSTGAGSVEKNLARWYGQFTQPDGSASKDAAKVNQKTVAGFPVTRVELGGRYVAEVRPGGGKRHDIPDYYMLAAIVEAKTGAYYFKMVGPEKAMMAARAGFDAMLDSVKAAG